MMTYLYHVTTEEGRTGLLEDQAFFDQRSCGWEYMWQALEWAKNEVQIDGKPRWVMRVRVQDYTPDPNFSYAVIESKDVMLIESICEINLSNL